MNRDRVRDRIFFLSLSDVNWFHEALNLDAALWLGRNPYTVIVIDGKFERQWAEGLQKYILLFLIIISGYKYKNIATAYWVSVVSSTLCLEPYRNYL